MFKPILREDVIKGWLFPEPLPLPVVTYEFEIAVIPSDWLTYTESNIPGPDYLEAGKFHYAVADRNFASTLAFNVGEEKIRQEFQARRWGEVLITYAQMFSYDAKRRSVLGHYRSMGRYGDSFYARVLLATLIAGHSRVELQAILDQRPVLTVRLFEIARTLGFNLINDGVITIDQLDGLFKEAS